MAAHRVDGPGEGDEGVIPIEEAAAPARPANGAPRAGAAPAIPRARGPETVVAKGPAKDKGLTCPKCGYALAGIAGTRCPECGTDSSKEAIATMRRHAHRVGMRGEYRKALLLALGGLLAMALIVTLIGWSRGELDVVPAQLVASLVSYAITLPLGLIAYVILASIWFGSDDPIPITALRLAAVYALADAADAVLSLVWILFLNRVLIFAVYVGLLMKLLDLEYIEAIVLALLTMALKLFVVLVLLAVLGVV